MELTVVIPVYNSEHTIGPLVGQLQTVLHAKSFEVILVDDRSRDGSAAVCQNLARQIDSVRFVSLRRNFGEFNAVLCGLNYARGQFTAIIDDDFQNPPEAILTLLDAARTGGFDVVYSRYTEKKHNQFRNAGSALLNHLTTFTLGKPRGLYLSSFKLINRAVVNEIVRYQGPYPYIDALIFRVTRNVTSVLVPHHSRAEGQSNYTFRKLVSLFLTVIFGYSTVPLRFITAIGLGILVVSTFGGLVGLTGWLTGSWPLRGWAVTLGVVGLLAGIQFVFLGVLSEYIGRLFMAQSGLPPYIVDEDESVTKLL